ncbi:MAG: 16S rRNA (guanine(527)-N(7))-methyltransferase RsmG [Endomicrobium sp.]|jgi:16S rRNA (guanine527-N7)-methyltransferase|nr:16S rRNA (guanine(527)-N(7))-methyltransferase RsmG [Endomicrobium sp.]
MGSGILFTEFQDYVVKNILPFFSEEILEKFKLYFYKLLEWNNVFNLISYKSEADLIYRHFCDSLYSAKIINDILNEETINYHTKHFTTTNSNLLACPTLTSRLTPFTLYSKVADLGTGAGMPGLPVKIVLPNIRLTLVESIAKKCKFLENVSNKLGFNIEILNKRAEDIGQMPSYRQHFDFILSRAVCKFSPNLEISIPLLKIGGHFIVYKTKNSIKNKEEGLSAVGNALKCLGAQLEKTISYTLPRQELDYCILVFKKYKNTPIQFPRKTGIPEKKPL